MIAKYSLLSRWEHWYEVGLVSKSEYVKLLDDLYATYLWALKKVNG